MPYEIPQELQYQEKIIFGLTFKQLAYAFLLGPVALAIFFKTKLNLYARVFLTLIPSTMAVMLMFLNLDTFLRNWIEWFKFREAKKGSQKLKEFIGVKEIKDNLIITKNKKIAILKVEPINFAIKSEGEQETVIQTFQKFLNSIDFPIQILMNTETLEVDSYVNSLEERINNNAEFENLFEKYKEHLKNTIANNNIMNRNFYLIIPESSGIDIQIRICEERLDNLNLKHKRLRTPELIRLVSKFFNGSGGLSLESLQPKEIHNYSDYIKINNTLNRVICAYGYPRIVEAGFLDKIVSCVGDFDLSLHIEPYPIETTMISLNKELQKQRADLYAAQLKNILNPSLEIKYKDTLRILEELQKGRDKLFNISLYVNCRAETKAELNLLTKKIESELNSLMIIPKIPSFRMAQGLISAAPLCSDKLNVSRNITTYALSAFFPFTSPFFQVDETGVWLGLNKNNIPIIKDIFKLSNPNGCILASSGAGKSYMAKLLISRYLLNGIKVIVIDPQGEYKNLVEIFKGQRINLSYHSDTIINPLDLMGHTYIDKRLALMDLMQIILGGENPLTEPQKSFIDRALTEAYRAKGITEREETWSFNPPILQDVLEILVSMEKRAITLEKSTIRSLINRLSMYVDGVFSFLNQHTNINFNNNFVCFDIGEMPKQVKPVIMFLVLDYVYMKMRKDIERKLLVIDEAWSLLSRTEDASYIFEIVKTCRKFNLGLLMINQEVEDLLNSNAGKSVLANSAYTLLMRQKPAVIEEIQETFHLSKQEKTHLLTAQVGEGILLMEDEHSEIKIVASEEEHKLITTNPDEILKNNGGNYLNKAKQCVSKKNVKQNAINEKQSKSEKKVFALAKPSERVVVDIKVDESKGFYKHKDLSLYEIKYLISKGYKEFSFYSILSKKKERYLLKLRKGESPQHFFLTFDIVNYLKKFTDKIWIFQTKKPDIVFEINNKKYAIEIETGKVYRYAKKQLIEKVKQLNKEFGKNWFFVVTNRNFYHNYNKFGKTYTKTSVVNKIFRLTKNTRGVQKSNTSF